MHKHQEIIMLIILIIFRQWIYLIEHPRWTETFPTKQPRIFARSSDGRWIRC